jgi:hypothetical protein
LAAAPSGAALAVAAVSAAGLSEVALAVAAVAPVAGKCKNQKGRFFWTGPFAMQLPRQTAI